MKNISKFFLISIFATNFISADWQDDIDLDNFANTVEDVRHEYLRPITNWYQIKITCTAENQEPVVHTKGGFDYKDFCDFCSELQYDKNLKLAYGQPIHVVIESAILTFDNNKPNGYMEIQQFEPIIKELIITNLEDLVWFHHCWTKSVCNYFGF